MTDRMYDMERVAKLNRLIDSKFSICDRMITFLLTCLCILRCLILKRR